MQVSLSRLCLSYDHGSVYILATPYNVMYACVVNLKNNRLVRCFESLKHKSVVVTVSDSIII